MNAVRRAGIEEGAGCRDDLQQCLTWRPNEAGVGCEHLDNPQFGREERSHRAFVQHTVRSGRFSPTLRSRTPPTVGDSGVAA